jgi:hypothetical protein
MDVDHFCPAYTERNRFMNTTIVAIYDDIVVARQVVEELVQAGFARDDVSLITNDAQNKYSHYLDKGYTPKTDAVTSGEGAGFGAVVGVLTGILVGATALTIPGIGLAIVAGPIVGAITGILAGAVTGGIVGALVKSGVPEDDAPYYAEGVRRGGTLVSIKSSDTLRAQDILNRHGSINIHERSSLWRQAGWSGFADEQDDAKDKASAEMLGTGIHGRADSPITDYIHKEGPTIDSPIRSLIEDVPVDDEDTVKAVPVIVSSPVTAIELPAGTVLSTVEVPPRLDEADTAH